MRDHNPFYIYINYYVQKREYIQIRFFNFQKIGGRVNKVRNSQNI